MSLRKVSFWLHLVAGLGAGSIIAVMSFTGAVLAFEHEIVEWAERDVRRVAPPAAGAAALPLDELLAKAREAATDPDAESAPRVSGVTVSSDPLDAIAINFGRDLGVYYINQYTGEVRVPSSTRTHDFMHLMVDWHRRLAATLSESGSGDNRHDHARRRRAIVAATGLAAGAWAGMPVRDGSRARAHCGMTSRSRPPGYQELP